MSIFKPINSAASALDKFDLMIDGIEKVHAMADIASTTELAGISQVILFRYFLIMAEILERVKDVATILSEDKRWCAERNKE